MEHLLDLPERAANGYKQYGVAHLIRLLRIRRLSGLGVPLAEIAAMEDEPDEAIRVLDAELAATVDRLTRVREELAVILRHRAPAYVPPEFAPVSRGLSERQRSLLMVYATVLSAESVEMVRALLGEAGSVDEEFEALPADSPRGARRAGEALAAAVVQLHNPAQLRVLERIIALLGEEGDGSGGPGR